MEMKMIHRFLSTLAAGLLLAAPGLAQDRYVDCDSGSDSAAGTASAPWRTLDHALGSFSGGEIAVAGACDKISVGGRSQPTVLRAWSGQTPPSITSDWEHIRMKSGDMQLELDGFTLIVMGTGHDNQCAIQSEEEGSRGLTLRNSVIRGPTASVENGRCALRANKGGSVSLIDTEIKWLKRGPLWNDRTVRGTATQVLIQGGSCHDIGRGCLNFIDSNLQVTLRDYHIYNQWPCGYGNSLVCDGIDHGSAIGINNWSGVGSPADYQSFVIQRVAISDSGTTGALYFYSGSPSVLIEDVQIDGTNSIQIRGFDTVIRRMSAVDFRAFAIKHSGGTMLIEDSVLDGKVTDPEGECGSWGSNVTVRNTAYRSFVGSCDGYGDSVHVGSSHFDDATGVGCKMWETCPTDPQRTEAGTPTHSCNSCGWDPDDDYIPLTLASDSLAVDLGIGAVADWSEPLPEEDSITDPVVEEDSTTDTVVEEDSTTDPDPLGQPGQPYVVP